MCIDRAYDEWADRYDTQRNLTRDLGGSVIRSELAGFRPATILEIGCGTGKNTGFLASIGGTVHALDFSRRMLARAVGRAEATEVERAEAGLKARARPMTGQDRETVTWALADLRGGWPVASGAIELVACNLVLEHIEDLESTFAEAARVLAAGGRLFVCELHPFRQYQGVRARYRVERPEEGADRTGGGRDGRIAGRAPGQAPAGAPGGADREAEGESVGDPVGEPVEREIEAFVHHVTDFLGAAERNGFAPERLREWWHAADEGKPPRLISFLFTRTTRSTRGEEPSR